jgi:hypothetical protein
VTVSADSSSDSKLHQLLDVSLTDSADDGSKEGVLDSDHPRLRARDQQSVAITVDSIGAFPQRLSGIPDQADVGVALCEKPHQRGQPYQQLDGHAGDVGEVTHIVKEVCAQDPPITCRRPRVRGQVWYHQKPAIIVRIGDGLYHRQVRIRDEDEPPSYEVGH